MTSLQHRSQQLTQQPGQPVSTELVEEVVAYTRVHLGAAVAADLGAESSDPGDLVLDAVCMLSCAGAFPPAPLGPAMLAAVQARHPLPPRD